MPDVEYYEDLWRQKSGEKRHELRKRDWFHRLFLDRVVKYDVLNSGTCIVSNLINNGDRVLDIGCWGGESALKMGLFEKFREVYGVDLIESSVKSAIEKGMKAVPCNLNSQNLPWSNDFFDTVICMAVLEHVFEPNDVIKEIYRVLKLNGSLFISVPNVASFSNRIRILFGKTPITSLDPGWDGGHLHYFTYRDIKNWLMKSGFHVYAKETSGSYHRIRSRLWIGLLGGTIIIAARKSSLTK